MSENKHPGRETLTSPHMAHDHQDDQNPVNRATPGSRPDGASASTAANASSHDGDNELRRENADLKDRLLRALADAENTRRRAERDLNDIRQYAITKFAGDMLPVVDNLERAIASVPAHVHAGEDAVKTMIDGVKLTEAELLRSLEKHDVKKLDPLGRRFDPHLHESVFAVHDPSVPTGTVVKVLEPGYTIGTRSLRPAKVGVSNGGPQHNPIPSSRGAGANHTE